MPHSSDLCGIYSRAAFNQVIILYAICALRLRFLLSGCVVFIREKHCPPGTLFYYLQIKVN